MLTVSASLSSGVIAGDSRQEAAELIVRMAVFVRLQLCREQRVEAAWILAVVGEEVFYGAAATGGGLADPNFGISVAALVYVAKGARAGVGVHDQARGIDFRAQIADGLERRGAEGRDEAPPEQWLPGSVHGLPEVARLGAQTVLYVVACQAGPADRVSDDPPPGLVS